MSTLLAIVLWWLAFAASHLVLSSLPVRRPLMARLGERGFQGVYSLVALATFVPLVLTWWGGRHGGGVWWQLRDVPGVTVVSIALGLLGFAMIASAFRQPTPMGMVPGAPTRAHGVTRITRHPLFMGVLPWALGHLLVNGWAHDVAFFGGFAVFTLIGCAHQDARRRETDGETLREFFAETSLLPFGAIVAGRTRLAPGELSWAAILVGAGVGYGLYLLHPQLFALGPG